MIEAAAVAQIESVRMDESPSAAASFVEAGLDRQPSERSGDPGPYTPVLETAPMRVATACLLVAVVGVGSLAACSRREPPAPDGSPSIAMPQAPAPSPAASSPLPPAASAGLGSPASSSASSSASAAAPSGPAVDSASLPQTRDRPTATGPAFDARVAALWSAIAADDPDRAMPFFFPLGAYQQVKDVSDAASDWKRRLVAAYAHDIHALHARLVAEGDDANTPRFRGLDVPDARARWVDPGEEVNKLGYYRVFGSKLRYDVGGAARSFDVKSLISWRGEWYVVHLSAIK
jgi:hypothetical protein